MNIIPIRGDAEWTAKVGETIAAIEAGVGDSLAASQGEEVFS